MRVTEVIYKTMENNFITEDVRKNVMREIYANPIYINLNKKYQRYRKQGDFAQALVYSKKMKNFEDEVFAMIAQRYINKHNIMQGIVDSMNEEDKQKMNILANAMYLLSDVLDSMITDTNRILKKYDACDTTGFDKLSKALKETQGLVVHFDALMDNDKASGIFSNCSDKLYKLVFNQSSSYVNKLKRYAEDINKKSASVSEVA